MPTGLQGFTAMIAGAESAVKWSGTSAGSRRRRAGGLPVRQCRPETAVEWCARGQRPGCGDPPGGWRPMPRAAVLRVAVRLVNPRGAVVDERLVASAPGRRDRLAAQPAARPTGGRVAGHAAKPSLSRMAPAVTRRGTASCSAGRASRRSRWRTSVSDVARPPEKESAPVVESPTLQQCDDRHQSFVANADSVRRQLTGFRPALAIGCG